MSDVVAGALVALLLLLLGLALSYNRFVRQRHLIRSSWSNIDTELRRRYDLIPNLVETVRAYAAHERATLDAVVAARQRAAASTGSPEQQAADERELVGSLQRLLALAEAYPDLQAGAQFLELQAQLVDTEDRIQAARRFFNGNVRDYNRRVESIPSMLVARMFGFEREQYFEVDPAVRR